MSIDDPRELDDIDREIRINELKAEVERVARSEPS